MKILLPSLFAVAGLFGTWPAAAAVDDPSATEKINKAWRVLAPKDVERRGKVEMESVAFLGVETMPVSATTAVQLGLPRGTGLVVNHVVPSSPAAGTLAEHDILLQLDDQILIETRQLSVLIRNHKENDEVALTYLRGGKKATARITLGKTEVPKVSSALGGGVLPFGDLRPGHSFEHFGVASAPDEQRADVDRVLSLIQRTPRGEVTRIPIEKNAGPGFRAMTMDVANSSMVYTDDDGALELTTKDGAKVLVAKNAKGELLFSGPVTTPEERKGMPPAVRARLEKLEGMHDITFHTDGSFTSPDKKSVRPRGIALPLPDGWPSPALPPAFY